MMKIKMQITRNAITVDDTAAATTLSVLCVHIHVGLDSGIVSTNRKNED